MLVAPLNAAAAPTPSNSASDATTVPIETAALKGIDSLLSIVQMPAGVPVGTLAIGKAGAINAALLAAAFSLVVGLPTFRLRGPYFTIATIGVRRPGRTRENAVVAVNLFLGIILIAAGGTLFAGGLLAFGSAAIIAPVASAQPRAAPPRVATRHAEWSLHRRAGRGRELQLQHVPVHGAEHARKAVRRAARPSAADRAFA